MPAECLGEAGREECREQRAGVSSTRNSHGEALMFGRIPAACHRQRNSETCSGYAEQHANEKDLLKRVGPEPAAGEWQNRERHSDEAGFPSPDRVREETKH